MKNTSFRKVLWLFYAVIAGILINTCDSPIALGLRVDTSEPTISINSDLGPGPGKYLKGTERIWIKAEDDSGIESVDVTYWYNVYGPDGKTLVERQRSIAATLDSDTGLYYFDVYTLEDNMVDGPFRAVVNVRDKSGKKIATPDLIYTVKNGPPQLSMQIPKARTMNEGKELLTSLPYPAVVTNNYMMGVFEDLAGVAKGYPWIKFWENGTPEPQDFRQNAGWSSVGSTDKDKGNGWVSVDEGFSESERGEKGGSFRYYLRDRKSNGEPFGEEDDKSLVPGVYNVKFYAVDILGTILEWPNGAYENIPNYMTVELVATGIPPVIEIMQPVTNKNTVYLRDNFMIEAQATLGAGDDLNTDIALMEITVKGQDKLGNKGEVTLVRRIGSDTGVEVPIDFEVILGATYYSSTDGSVTGMANNINGVPSNEYPYVTFNDGNFNFTITAVGGPGGTKGTAPLSLYIDRQPPNTQVTEVSPHFSQDNIALTASADAPNNNNHGAGGPDPYRRWTVNSTIRIKASSSDNRGAAIDEETGYEKFKYLVLKNADIQESLFTTWKTSNPTGTFGDYLYQRSDAMFLEEVKASPKQVPPSVTGNGNPMSKVEGSDGDYTLTFQTHKFDTDAETIPYKIWAYVVSMDNADNVSYQKILLNIDQTTDEPKITFGNINSDGTTFMDDKYVIRLTVKDDDGLTANSIQFRYAQKMVNGNPVYYDGDDTWKNIPAGTGLSEDGLEININDLTLLKIAGLYLGHLYGATHEMDNSHKSVLGDERDTKYLEVKATDNEGKKIYSTDGIIISESNPRPFTMDLIYPKVVASTKTLLGGDIIRTVPTELNPDLSDNPFGAPEKDKAYKALEFAYGDIVEQNLKSITVKIDGNDNLTRTYPVVIEDYTATQPLGTGFAVWKAVPGDWNGELRWRIPMSDFNFNMPSVSEGSHTFEISFEDKVPQIVTKSLTFYKDTTGPTVNFIIPGNNIYINETEANSIENDDSLSPELAARYSNLAANSIQDAAGKLVGTFVDEYSPIASAWYQIDNGGWLPVPADFSNGSKSVSWNIGLPTGIEDGVHRLSFMIKDESDNGYDTTNQTQFNALPEKKGGPGYEKDRAFLLDRGVPTVEITNNNLLYGKTENSSIFINVTVTGVRGVDEVKIDLNNNVITYDTTLPGVNASLSFTSTNKTTHTFKVPVNAGYVIEGTNSVTITVKGSSKIYGTGFCSFTYDETPPKIELGNPFGNTLVSLDGSEWTQLRNAVKNNTMSPAQKQMFKEITNVNTTVTNAINVNFSDDYSNIDEVWYRITGYDIDGTIGDGAADTTFTNTSSANNWVLKTLPVDPSKIVRESIGLNKNINYPNPAGGNTPLLDGIYRLSVRVKDHKGNTDEGALTQAHRDESKGIVENVVFILDRSTPVITISDPDNNGIIRGTINNTFGVEGFIVSLDDVVKINSNIDNYVTSAGSRNFTFEINIAEAFGDLSDGSYFISVEATGSSGQSKKETKEIIIDTTPPTITVGAPVREAIYVSNTDWTAVNSAINSNNYNSLSPAAQLNFASLKTNSIRTVTSTQQINFTISDDNSAINGYDYKFDDSVAWTSVTNSTNAKSLNVSITMPTTEGIHRLSIRAKDRKVGGIPGNGYGIADDTTVEGLAVTETNNGAGFVHNLVFMVDTSVPTITASVTEDSNNNLTGFRVEISDTFEVVKLTIDPDWTTVVNVDTANSITPNGKREFEYDGGGLVTGGGITEGSRSITITVEGSSGQSRTVPVNFVYDKTPPVIAVGAPVREAVYVSNADWTAVSGAINSNNYNSLNPTQETKFASILTNSIRTVATNQQIAFTISDENSAIYGFDYRFNDNLWTSVPNTATPNAKSLNVSLTMPPGEGIHSLSIRAKDKKTNGYDTNDDTTVETLALTETDNGKGFVHNLVFMVDTSVPTIAEPSLTWDSNGAMTGFTGTITNTFEVVELTIKPDWASEITADPEPGAYRTFTYDGSDIITGITEGSRSITITATGSSGQKSTFVKNFVYDLTPPTIAVGAPVREAVYVSDTDWTAIYNAVANNTISSLSSELLDTYNSIQTNSIRTVTGGQQIMFTISDENSAISEYGYSIDGGAWTYPNLGSTPTSKSLNIPITMPPGQGIHRLSIRAKDGSGRGYGSADNISSLPISYNGAGFVYNLVFMVDTTTPVITAEVTEDSNNNLTGFNVTITDTFKVVKLTIDPDWTNAFTATAAPDGNRTFTYDGSSLVTGGGITEGSRSITITAEGSSGQTRTYPLNFVYDKTPPAIAVGAPVREAVYVSNTDWTAISNAVTNNTIGSLGALSLSDKYASIQTNSIRTLASNQQITFTISDENSAIYGYDYKFDDGTWIIVPNSTNSKSLNVSLTMPTAEGIHSLSIRAKDKKVDGSSGNGYDTSDNAEVEGLAGVESNNGKGFVHNLVFMVDTTTPVINANVTENPATNELTAFNVEITNTFDVVKLTIDPDWTNAFTATAIPGGNRRFTYDGNSILTGITEGSRSITITAEGSSGQSRTVTENFVYDKTPPDITVGAPIRQAIYVNNADWAVVSGAVANNTIGSLGSGLRATYDSIQTNSIRTVTTGQQIMVTISDENSAIKEYDYKFDYETNWHNTNLGSTPTSKSLNIPISMPTEQGIYSLSIRAKDLKTNGYGTADDTDGLANNGAGFVHNLVFMVDTSVPAITASVTEDSNNELTGFNVTITNTFGVVNLTIDPDWTSAFTATPVPGAYRTFTYDGSSILTGITEGSRSITITVEGSSGQTRTVPVNFVYDKTPPAIAVGAPVREAVYVSNADWSTIYNAVDTNTISSLGALSGKYNSIQTNSIRTVAPNQQITFTISDENSAIYGYDYKFDNGSWTSVLNDTTTPNAKSLNVTLTMPTTTTEEGIHRLSIRAKDKKAVDGSAGNGFGTSDDTVVEGLAGMETRNGEGFVHNLVFMVDTTTPVISANINEDSNNNITGFNVTITNTFDVVGLTIEPDWTDAIPAVATPGAYRTFTYNDSSILTGITEGSRSITVTAIGSSGQSRTVPVNFVYDKTPPTIAVGAPIRQAIYVNNADWTAISSAINSNNYTSLTNPQQSTYTSIQTNSIRTVTSGQQIMVTISDENSAIKEYDYRFNNDATWTSPLLSNPTSKSLNIPITMPTTEGIHSLSIRAKDLKNNGKGTADNMDGDPNNGAGFVHNLVFMVDTSVPTIAQPSLISDSNGTMTSFTGTITNTFEVVELSIKPDWAAEINPTVTGNGHRAFTYDGGSILTSIMEGSRSITITATGSSGQKSTYVENFVYDLTPPVISVGAPVREAVYVTSADWTAISNAINSNDYSSLSPAQHSIYETLIENSIRTVTDGQQIMVTISDEHSAISEYGYSVDGGAWITPSSGSTSKSLNIPIPMPAGQGIHRLSLHAKDGSGRGYGSADINSSLPIVDNGKGFVYNLVFIVDTSVPTITLVQDTSNQKHFTGTIGNTFAANLSVVMDWVNSDIPVSVTNVTPNGSRTFTIDYTAPSAIDIPQGLNSITATVVGSSGQTASYPLTFIHDTIGPVITVNSPISAGGSAPNDASFTLSDAEFEAIAQAIEKNTIATLNGSLLAKYEYIIDQSIQSKGAPINVNFTDDNSNIKEYSYTISKVDFDGSNNATGISTVVNSTNTINSNRKSVSAGIELKDSSDAVLADGLYRINITATDANLNPVANSTTLSHIAFIQDTGIPTVTVKSTANAVIGAGDLLAVTNTGLSFNVTVDGTFAVKNLNVSLNGIDITEIGGSVPAVTPVTGEKGTFVSNNISITALPVTLETGYHTISVTAAGSSGRSATTVRNFVYDKTPPDITFNAPVKDKSLTLTDSEFQTIHNAIVNKTTGALTEPNLTKFNSINSSNSIKDSSVTTLTGSFTDAYSNVFADGKNTTFDYRIDQYNSGNNYASWAPTVSVPSGDYDKKSVDWTVPLPSNLADGIYRVSLRVTDELSNGPGVVENVAFIVDRGNPAVALEKFVRQDGTTILDGQNNPVINNPILSKPFTIHGTIKNTLRIQRLNILLNGETYAYYVGVDGVEPAGTGVYVNNNGTITKEASNAPNPTITVSVAGNPTYYEYTANINVTTGDGSKSVSVIAYGTSGISGNRMAIFTYDTEGPVISLNPPFMSSTLFGHIVGGEVVAIGGENIAATNSIVDSAITISGAFNDSFSAIYKAGENTEYWYKVDGRNGYSNNIVGQGWLKGTSFPSLDNGKLIVTSQNEESNFLTWKITLPANSQGTEAEHTADGNYLLSIRIKDSLGNGCDQNDNPAGNSGPGFLTNLAFNIDRGIPALAVDQLPQFQSGDVTFNVTVSNTSAVTRLDVKQGSDYLADWGSLAGTNPPNGFNITQTGTNPATREYFYTVTIPAAGLTEGNYNLVITATGSSGVTAMVARAFIYDKTPPVVTFTSPAPGTQTAIGTWGASNSYREVNSGTWVTGSPQISGTTNDGNSVKEVSYRIGKLAADESTINRNTVYADPQYWTATGLGTTDQIHADWDGGLFYWIFQRNLNNFENSGNTVIDKDLTDSKGRRFFIPLYVRVTDQAGNINVTRYRIWVDPDMDMPTAAIINPVNNNDVGGTDVRISGTASDNNMVHSVEIRIKPVDTTGLTGLVNGYYIETGENWAYGASPANASDQGWIKADLQNNQQDIIVSWSYLSNKDGGLTPANAGDRREVIIEVRAVDTKDIDQEQANRTPDLKGEPISITVYFASGVPEIDTPHIHKTGLPDINADELFGYGLKRSGTFTITTTVHDDGGINSLKARVTSGNGYVEIIRNGAVVTGATLGGGTTYAITGQPTSGALSVAGRRYQLTTIPAGTINWGDIDVDFATNPNKKYEAGTWIRLKQGFTGVSGILGFVTNGGNTANSDTDTSGWNSQFFKYDVEFTVDSLVNLPYGKTGKFTLDLQVLDNNQLPQAYSANGSYSLDIDNFYPSAVIQTQFNAVTQNFYVKGTAEDYNANSGPVQGLARMLVYFERNGTFYNAAAGVSSGMTTRPDVKNMAITPVPGDSPNGSLANFPVLTQRSDGVWTSNHAMVIDRQELGDTTDSDTDGTYGEMWDDKGATKNWQARFNTTAFGDGPLTVHYVIMDDAGNATHYREIIYVGNNAPMIRTITLGTSLSGGADIVNANPIIVGTTLDGATRADEIPTNFRVRNSRFRVQLEALYGNSGKHYRVYYVTRNANPINSTAMDRGTVYTIANPGNTNWVSYGALNNNVGTTFVASGRANTTNDSGDATTGTVYQYIAAGAEQTGDFVNDIANNINFTNFANIPDSTVPTNPPDPANPPLQRDRRFIIKVYDTTQSGAGITEADQLAHVALINLDINNSDTLAPAIYLAPFGQEYVLRTAANDNDNPIWANNTDRVLGPVSAYTRNVVTINNDGTGTKKGYVQYAADSTASDGLADVSGMVIFKGKVADNNRINRITATIPGYNGGNGVGTAFDIATYSAANGLVAATNTTTIDAMRPDNAASARGFEQDNHNLTLDYNHVANWSFAWDTSTVTNVAVSNVQITFTVYDGRNNTAGSHFVTTNVNIVPYIAEVITPLTMANSANPSAFNRSANGWYPVREDDTILLRGFNFNGASTSVAVNNTALNGVAEPAAGAEVNGVRIPTGTTNVGRKYLTARVDSDGTSNTTNTITSGELHVTVNGIRSLNNNNNTTAAYNQEPNNLNNNILNDDRHMYVWNTGPMVNYPIALNPIMRMDNSANRYITFGSYFTSTAANGTVSSENRGQLKLIRNNDNLLATGAPQSHTSDVLNNAGNNGTVFHYTNRFVNNAIGVTANGEWAVASSQMTSNGASFTFAYNNFGTYRTASASGVSSSANTSINARRYMVSLGEDYNRIKPRIVMRRTVDGTAPVAASPTRAVLAYYDNSSGTDANNNASTYPIILNYGYFYGTEYTTTGFTGNTQFDGVTPTTGTFPANYPSATYQVADRNSTAGSSQYLAAGLLNNGRAVIAWYDAQRQCLWFSYGNNATTNVNTTVPTTTKTEWQNRAVKIKDYAGTHVDMAVDANNGIHLAYVDARNGGLWYTYIANATAPATNTTVRVDTYLSTGTKLTINVRTEGARYVPYITYIHNAFAETKNSVRVAWQKNSTLGHGTNEDHTFTGNWEVMTVPAGSIPNTQEFVSNGVPAGGSLTAPNFEVTDTNPTLIHRLRDSSIANTILVGYMTDRWYEGAILKYNIRGQ